MIRCWPSDLSESVALSTNCSHEQLRALLLSKTQTAESVSHTLFNNNCLVFSALWQCLHLRFVLGGSCSPGQAPWVLLLVSCSQPVCACHAAFADVFEPFFAQFLHRVCQNLFFPSSVLLSFLLLFADSFFSFPAAALAFAVFAAVLAAAAVFSAAGAPSQTAGVAIPFRAFDQTTLRRSCEGLSAKTLKGVVAKNARSFIPEKVPPLQPAWGYPLVVQH